MWKPNCYREMRPSCSGCEIRKLNTRRLDDAARLRLEAHPQLYARLHHAAEFVQICFSEMLDL